MRDHYVLKFCLILLLSLYSCTGLFAQGLFPSLFNLPIGVDFEMGGSMPANKNIREIYTVGLHASAGFKVAVLKNQKLWIKPVGGLKWYYKQVDKENSITENLRIIKAGMELQYSMLEARAFTFAPVIRIDHNWCAHYYSATYNTGSGYNYTEEQKSEKYFKGTGISADLGMRIQKRDWYVKLDYELFQPELKLNQTLIDEAYSQGYIVAPTHKFNFNSFNIGFGCDLIFNK